MDDINNSQFNNENQDVSKKERREARKEERMRDQSAARRENNIKRYGLWGGMLVGLAVLIWALAQYGGGGSATGDLATAVTDADWSKGKADATVVLVEYGDFQCPACAAYFGLVKEVFEQYKDRAKFVYRQYPLKSIHANAELAAKAAEAAGKQGKFWEMHDYLYNNQSAWSALSNVKAKEIFVTYARTLGLNVNQFTKDIDSDEVKDLVNSDLDSGNASHVTGTPTFFLNGKKINNPQSVDQFKKLLDNAL